MQRRKSLQYVMSLIASISAVTINYLIILALTHHITENMGTEAYGFVSLAKSFASYALVITAALNSYVARFVSVHYLKEDYAAANRYFSSVFFADCIITCLFIAMASVAIFYLEYILDIPEYLLWDVKLLFVLDVVNFGVMTCTTVFTSSPLIANRYDLSGLIRCMAYCLEGLLLICLYSMLPQKLYYVGIGLLVSSAFLLTANTKLSRRLTPYLKIRRTDVSIKAMWEVIQKGLWNSFNQLGNLLNNGLDLIVTNLMISPYVTGQLAIVKTISTIATTLFQLFAQPLQPMLVKYFSHDQKDKLLDTFKFGIKINGMVANILFAGLATWGTVYYKLLTPGQDVSMLQMLTIVTICGSVIEGAVYPLYYTYTLTLRNRIPAIVTVLSGLCNVAAMYVLIRYSEAGAYSVVGTTAVLSWIVNFVFTPIYTAHCLKQHPFVFYPVLLRQILSCGILVCVFQIISKLLIPSTWVELIAVAFICSVIGAVLNALVVCSRSEINQIFGMLRGKLLRR